MHIGLQEAIFLVVYNLKRKVNFARRYSQFFKSF